MEKIYMCPVCNAELRSKNTVDSIVENVIQHYKKTHPKITIPQEIRETTDYAPTNHKQRNKESS